MISIKQLYKIGPGPSSSHTIGPKNAVEYILNKYTNFDFVEMTFFGSLAETGKGHLSDYIADKTFKDVPHEIKFDYETRTRHPNTMLFRLFKEGEVIKEVVIESVGGGLIKVKGQKLEKEVCVYPHSTYDEIKAYCLENNLKLIDYIYKFEDQDIDKYMDKILDTMLKSIENGLKRDGLLPGKLKVARKAKELYSNELVNEPLDMREKRLISAYAFAVSEENASGKLIVTSPTCGACGIVPSLVRYNMDKGVTREKIKEGLLIAGLIGVIVKHNASISGAECGCQAEIGTASSMGAGFLASINGGDIFDIERASEIALEHSLGLTCDPIEGYVQIPCIERNAIGANRSMIAYALSRFMGKKDSKISLDNVIRTMYFTGKDLNKSYRETARGGLAKTYTKRIKKI